VRVLGESVYEANSIGYLDLATERSQTTTAVGDALSAAGIARGGLASSASMEAPGGAVAILDHAQIHLEVGCSPLNTDSNNEFADILVRHIGWRIEGESSTGAGAPRGLAAAGASTGHPARAHCP